MMDDDDERLFLQLIDPKQLIKQARSYHRNKQHASVSKAAAAAADVTAAPNVLVANAEIASCVERLSRVEQQCKCFCFCLSIHRLFVRSHALCLSNV